MPFRPSEHSAHRARFERKRRAEAAERQRVADGLRQHAQERCAQHTLYPPRPLEGLGTNVNVPRAVTAAGEQSQRTEVR